MSGTISKLALHSTTNNASQYIIPPAGTFTPTAGSVLVIFGYVGGSVDTAATCLTAAFGVTWTTIASDPHTLAGAVSVLLVSTIVPAGPSAAALTLTLPADAGTSAILWVAEVSGCLAGGASAIRSVSGTPQVAKTLNITAGGTWAATFANAPLTTNPILGFIGHTGGAVATPPGVSPPAGFTEVEEPVDQTAAVIGAEFCKADSGISSAGPHQFTSSVATTRANLYFVEFDTTAGGGGATRPRDMLRPNGVVTSPNMAGVFAA